MNFSVHCQKAASKANQALGMIKRNFKYMSKSSPYDIIKNICPTTSGVLRADLESPLL